jgi:hypothetical protein
MSSDDMARADKYLNEAEALLRELHQRLVCGDCGVYSDRRARDWRTFLCTEDDDSTTVVVLCPDCAKEVVDA